jgi:hypothetical protein
VRRQNEGQKSSGDLGEEDVEVAFLEENDTQLGSENALLTQFVNIKSPTAKENK